jgi:hypothetical protein
MVSDLILVWGPLTRQTLKSKTEPEEEFRKRTAGILSPQIQSALVVAGLLVVDLFLVWALAHMNNSLGAGVNLTFKTFGADVVVTSVGLVGAFLAIAIVSLTATYIFIRKD